MDEDLCVRCGAAELYRREAGVVESGGGGLFIRAGTFIRRGPLLDVVVCGVCGYVMFEVPHHDLDTLQTIFQKDGWTPVKRSNGMS
jgi:hypothetical protein